MENIIVDGIRLNVEGKRMAAWQYALDLPEKIRQKNLTGENAVFHQRWAVNPKRYFKKNEKK